jgi:hypothetical protein
MTAVSVRAANTCVRACARNERRIGDAGSHLVRDHSVDPVQLMNPSMCRMAIPTAKILHEILHNDA